VLHHSVTHKNEQVDEAQHTHATCVCAYVCVCSATKKLERKNPQTPLTAHLLATFSARDDVLFILIFNSRRNKSAIEGKKKGAAQVPTQQWC
jgi:hypothetical protein